MVIPTHRRITFSVTMEQDDRTVDVTPFTTAAQITTGDVSTIGTGNQGGDGVAASATLNLTSDRGALLPNADSHWNKPTPLLRPNRPVLVRTTIDGNTTTLFDGLLGDRIRVAGNGGKIELKMRDRAKRLMDIFAWAENPSTYGSAAGTPIATVLQTMLDDNNAGVTLRVATPPNFLVGEYQPEYQSLWDMMQALVTQIGWYLGYRRDESDDTYKLTLLEPPRNKTAPDLIVGGPDVTTFSVDESDRDMRTSAVGFYVDAGTRQRTRVPTTGFVENTDAVNALGLRKVMVFEEDATSQIDTYAQMHDLLEAAVHDLSSQLQSLQVETPLLPETQLFDLWLVDAPTLPEPRTVAVSNLQHTIRIAEDGATLRTTISGSATVVGRTNRWLDLEPRPGSPGARPPGEQQQRLRAPTVTLSQANPGFTVSVDDRGETTATVQVFWSTTQGFAPGPATLRTESANRNFTYHPGNTNTHYVRVRLVAPNGFLGTLTEEQSVTPN